MHKFLVATSFLALGVSGSAFAQERHSTSEPTSSTQNASGGSSVGLEDIVVTAQRKAESSQRASVAISVIGGEGLRGANVTRADGLNDLVPALTVQPSGSGNLIFIRGVGNFTLTQNADPATAFNYDGVYIGRPKASGGVFYDLERVEVLKGPQGTLYGRNATGGAINVIPVQPKEGELSAFGSFSYGNYDAIIAEAAINAPMGDDGAIRISGMRSKHDGYFRDGTSDEDVSALRVQLKAELTPDITVRVSGDYANNGGTGPTVGYLGAYAYDPLVGNYNFVPAPLPVSDGILTPEADAYRVTLLAGPAGRLLDVLNISPYRDDHFYGANAQIDWTSELGTLTIVPAWRYNDLDSLTTGGAFGAYQLEQDEQFSVEARFAGNRIGMIDYTVGILYYDEKIKSGVSLSTSAIAVFQEGTEYTTESIAPFGRLTAHLSDRFRLTGGIRYTRDKKTVLGQTTSAVIACLAGLPPSCPNAPLFPVVRDISQIPFAFPVQGAPPLPLFGGGVPSGAIVIRSDRFDDDQLTSTKITWRGAVEYDVGPQSLLYASVETGFRSGGFNSATGFDTFEPEAITAYTLGSKNRFFDNRLQLNLEAFWWEYRDQQVSTVRPDLSGRSTNITDNIGQSRIRGFEIESKFLITPTTLLRADVQYLHSRNQSFAYVTQNPGIPPLTGCNATLNTTANVYNVDCAGKPGFNAPKWTINIGVQQTFEFGDYDLIASTDTQYRDERYIGFLYTQETLQPSVWKTSAQLRFGPSDDQWSVSAFVRNIENNRTPVFSASHPAANILAAGVSDPRTYGVRASFNF